MLQILHQLSIKEIKFLNLKEIALHATTIEMLHSLVSWGSFYQIRHLGLKFSFIFSTAMRSTWLIGNLHHRVPMAQVDILDVVIQSSWEFPTFLDALLWSCHPRRLNLLSTSAMFTCIINCLTYMKNLNHAPSHENEPSHSELKEAKVYKFDKKSQSWDPVELKRGELLIRTTSEWDKNISFY